MKYLLPALSAFGLVIAAAVVVLGDRASTGTPVLVGPVAPSPFDLHVAGGGILEASTQDIAVATPVAGIVSAIFVSWGAHVNPGDPLFQLDDRDLQARLVSATARVKTAEAVLLKGEHFLELGEQLGDTDSISRSERTARKDDVVIHRANLEEAKALVSELRTEIERRTVRSPVAGRILKINVRRGELALSDGTGTPLVLLGDDTRLNVRVEVDQHDAWRVRPEAKAVAFVRGNPALKIALTFVRIEPYVLPKTLLTGKTTERTDMRVLQVIYGFDRGTWPVYAGQEVDVFIEAPAAGTN